MSGLKGRLVHQKNWNVISYGINAMALAAFEALSVRLLDQRRLADGANQNVKQVL
jgi:hypothetical protein